MKCRIGKPLFMAAVLALTALSVGSAGLLAAAVMIILLLIVSAVSVSWAAATLTVRCALADTTLTREQSTELRATVRHRCPLPVAPVGLFVSDLPGYPERLISLKGRRGSDSYTMGLMVAHVGVFRMGVRSCTVSDPFGFFTVERETPEATAVLTILPRTFDVEKLKFAPADTGLGTMATAREDASDPMDVRAWQRGDSLKKVHWKLSARRRTLLTRRFEEPALPEVLVLLDCTRPERGIYEGTVADALLETAASVFAAQEKENCELRLPLWGSHPTELTLRMGLPLALERLAQVDFSVTEGFDRELIDAARRVRQIGAAVVITSRLTGRLLDPLIMLRRQGPAVRLYLVTVNPDREDWQPLIARLQRVGIEVCSVMPPGGNTPPFDPESYFRNR